MSGWQGKSKGTPLGYRIFVFIMRSFGVQPAYVLLRFVAFYYFLFSYSSSAPILQYFHKRLGFGKLRSLKLLYKNYYVFGQTIIDKIVIMGRIKNKFTYYFDGVENLHDAVKKGKGGIILSAHVGNWEAAGHLLEHLHTKINIVMYDGEYQQIKDYVTEVTGSRNFNIIVIKDDISHVYSIGEALQKNEMVCLHADRFVAGSKTKIFPFLGADASFPLGPFALAATFKVPVLFAFAFKETSMHYHLYGSSAVDLSTSPDKQHTIETLMQNFVHHLEDKVRQYPEQWFNYYNFWK